MHPRYCAVLILLLYFQLIAPSSGALSEYTTHLSDYIAALNCEGWADNAAAKFLTADQNLASPAIVFSIPDDLLKEYHCQDKNQRVLQRGQRKIFIEAYQFATVDGAYGAYCAARRGSSSYLAQGDASSEDQDSISFCKNKYFVYLHSSELDDDEAKVAINKLTHQLIERLESIEKTQQSNPEKTANYYSDKPSIFNSMPTLERVRGSEKLVMGPISLKRFFTAPYVASLAPLLKGAVADYRIEEPHRDRLKLLIAYYPTAQAASMIYANYISTLAHQNDEKSAEGFTYATTLFKVSDSYLLCQLRDKQIVVIKGARHKDTLSELAHQIYF
jgi:hypothetical protein